MSPLSLSAIAIVMSFNNEFRKRMEANGLIVSGRSADNTLVEVMELADHPWFVGSQFHPEFQEPSHTPASPVPRFRRGQCMSCAGNGCKPGSCRGLLTTVVLWSVELS